MSEEWRPAVGYEGLYEVSSLGRVRSMVRAVAHKTRTGKIVVRRYVGMMRQPYADKDGYLSLHLNKEGHRKAHRVHHLVAEAFVCARPEGLVCRHLDGDLTNNVPTNLAWGTQLENAADTIKHERYRRGSAHYRAKLDDAAVRHIRASKGVVHRRVLAEAYGVDVSHINLVQRRKVWGHI